MKIMLTVVLLSTVSYALSESANAALIVDTGPGYTAGDNSSGISIYYNSQCAVPSYQSPCHNSTAGLFTLNDAYTITGIESWLSGDGDIDLAIYNTVGITQYGTGLPGTELYAITTNVTEPTVNGFNGDWFGESNLSLTLIS